MRDPVPPSPRGRRRPGPVTLLTLACAAAIVVGFAGAYGRPFDSLSHFRAHLGALAAILAFVALARRRPALALASAGAATLALAASLPWMLPQAPVPPGGASYTLLQMNLRWNAADKALALQRVADARPDVVTLQEMTPEWRAMLAPLSESYPYQVHCDGADGFVGDSALLSRRPFVPGAETVCDERNSIAAARVDFNGTPVTIVSHHQLWPWPRGQWRRFDRLAPTLEDLAQPLILAGDFNAVPWSRFVQSYAEATGTAILPGIGPVWFPHPLPASLARYAGLPLGNVLASPQVTVLSVERMAATSSDHLPILVRFAVAPAERDGSLVRVVAR